MNQQYKFFSRSKKIPVKSNQAITVYKPISACIKITDSAFIKKICLVMQDVFYNRKLLRHKLHQQ